eukprot:3509935-Rhodomonas_salina.1
METHQVMEVAKLDVCDVLWDFDRINTQVMPLWSRKNDRMKLGLFPRMGQGSASATCPVVLILEYMEQAGVCKSQLCTKRKPGWTQSPCKAVVDSSATLLRAESGWRDPA